jgi:hypothetical protein
LCKLLEFWYFASGNTFTKEIIVSILTIIGLKTLLKIEPNLGLNIMNSICKGQLHGNKFPNLVWIVIVGSKIVKIMTKWNNVMLPHILILKISTLHQYSYHCAIQPTNGMHISNPTGVLEVC